MRCVCDLALTCSCVFSDVQAIKAILSISDSDEVGFKAKDSFALLVRDQDQQEAIPAPEGIEAAGDCQVELAIYRIALSNTCDIG